jgi:hypothetical protein
MPKRKTLEMESGSGNVPRWAKARPQGFEHEHDLRSLAFGIVIVHVARNKINFYRPLFPQWLNAVATIKAGEVVHVYGLPVD